APRPRRAEPMYRRAAIATVVTCHLLVLYYAWRALSGPWTWPALVVGVLAGHLLADGLTLAFHWTLDNYKSAQPPVLGPVIFFFRETHADRVVMFGRDYFEGSFENALAGVVLLLAVLPLSLPPWASVMFAVTALAGAYITQIHKWAHQPAPSWS